MNGVHDMGGMHGFGKVEPDSDERPFHAAWEARVLAMQRAIRAARAWNIDMSRDAIERQPPQRYLAASYYERWLMGMETSAVEKGLVDPDEIAAGRALRTGKPVAHVMTKNDLGQSFTRGSFSRPAQHEARFKPGDRVRARNINPPTHTRLPRYARGHEGVIEAVRGCHVFPDSVTTGRGEDPQWLYTVVFNGRDVWGPHADPTLTVSIEAFEPYLEPA
jgi:nitrile hydratase beta subunit